MQKLLSIILILMLSSCSWGLPTSSPIEETSQPATAPEHEKIAEPEDFSDDTIEPEEPSHPETEEEPARPSISDLNDTQCGPTEYLDNGVCQSAYASSAEVLKAMRTALDRSHQARRPERINVRAMGSESARGTRDSADASFDTRAIQKAIDRAIAEKKDVVLPVGDYLITDTLVIRNADGLAFEGEGIGQTRLFWAGPPDVPMIRVSSSRHVTLEGFWVRSNEWSHEDFDIVAYNNVGGKHMTVAESRAVKFWKNNPPLTGKPLTTGIVVDNPDGGCASEGLLVKHVAMFDMNPASYLGKGIVFAETGLDKDCQDTRKTPVVMYSTFMAYQAAVSFEAPYHQPIILMALQTTGNYVGEKMVATEMGAKRGGSFAWIAGGGGYAQTAFDLSGLTGPAWITGVNFEGIVQFIQAHDNADAPRVPVVVNTVRLSGEKVAHSPIETVSVQKPMDLFMSGASLGQYTLYQTDMSFSVETFGGTFSFYANQMCNDFSEPFTVARPDYTASLVYHPLNNHGHHDYPMPFVLDPAGEETP